MLKNDLNGDVKIIRISKILNLTGNSVVKFSLDDISTLLNLKKEKTKQYRKFYFLVDWLIQYFLV